MAVATSTSWFQHWEPPATLLSQFNNHDHQTNFQFFQVGAAAVDENERHSTGKHHDVFPVTRYDKEPVYQHRHEDSQGNKRLFQQNGHRNGYYHKTFHPPLQKQQNMANILPYLISLGMVSPSSGVYGYAEPVSSETTGPLRTLYQWKQLDFAYPSEEARASAIENEEFIPENNLPLGVEVYKDRMFVSMPKWKPGVPCTLAVLPKVPRESSPALVPYPSWNWHNRNHCDLIVSVYRMQADVCDRLWVLDSGQIDVTTNPRQVCPPKVLIFDLKSDELIKKYVLPKKYIKEDGLFSNIIIDVMPQDCDDAYAYLTDVWRYAIVVYSLRENRSWRVYDHLFMPDPLAAAYKLHDLEFEWSDGIFGMALAAEHDIQGDRIMYFHPMSSFREFYTKTSVMKNETGWENVKNAFDVMGQSRGKSGHVSASGMDRNGIMFYNLVTRDTIGCWDSRKPYKRANLGVVAKNHSTLIFPNDIKVDNEERQSIWVLTNKLPYYLYKGLDPTAVNFRIMSAFADDAIRGTICDPLVARADTFEHHHKEEDCY